MKKLLFIAIALVLLGIGAWVLMPKDAAPSPTAPSGEAPAGAVSTSTTSGAEPSTDTTEISSAVPTPTPAPAPKPSGYTMAEVSAHADASSCWTAIEGNVYDLTAWISKHPGGKSAILRLCGVDGTQEFNDQHGGQGKPERELAAYKIGALI